MVEQYLKLTKAERKAVTDFNKQFGSELTLVDINGKPIPKELKKEKK